MCGDDSKKDPPVPIPNTEVKLLSAEDSLGLTYVKAGRRHARFLYFYIKHYSAIAQSVERATVNRVVAGSRPACGVFIYLKLFPSLLFTFIIVMMGYFFAY